MVYFASYIIVYTQPEWIEGYSLLNEAYMIATFAKIALGFFQVVSMFELTLRLKCVLNVEDPTKMKKLVKLLYCCVGLINICVLCALIFEIVDT